MSSRIQAGELLVGYREGMSCVGDLETLKDWLEYRVWSACSRASRDYEMTQKQFANAAGIGESTVSGIMNRKRDVRIGDDVWPKLVDYWQMSPERAFALSRRWKETEDGRRWLARELPSGDLPPASHTLLAAIAQLKRRGESIEEGVVLYARAILRETGDHSERSWVDVLLMVRATKAADVRRLLETRKRARIRSATDLSESAHEGQVPQLPPAPAKEEDGKLAAVRKLKKR